MTLLTIFLSLALAIASLLVMHERRQRRGLQSLLDGIYHREPFFHDQINAHEIELPPNKRNSKAASTTRRGSKD